MLLAVSGASTAIAQTASTSNASAAASNNPFRPLTDYWEQLCKQPNSPANSAMYHCEPGVSFYVGMMYLQRSRSGGVISTPPTGTPGTLFNADSLHYGWDGTPEFVVQVRPADGWAVEGRYFYDRSSIANPVTVDVTSFRTAGIGVTVLGGGTLMMNGNTQFTSGEVNVIKQFTPGFSLLGGWRRITLNDNLMVGLVGTGLNITTWKETNTLEGGQIGARLAFATPGFSALQFDVTGKTGAYHNAVTNDFTSQVVSRARSSGWTPAYVTEANLGITLQLLPNVAVRGGFMMVWLNNLSLAGATAPGTVQQAGGTASPVTTNSSLHYSGATGQLNVAF